MSEVSADSRFLAEVREFLARELPRDWHGGGSFTAVEYAQFRESWRRTLYENGLLGVAWPTAYGGRGLTLSEQAILIEEFARAGVPILPGANDALGFNLLAPTLLQLGTEDQKQRFLPGTLSGDIRWAQGYSEPDAGSDLFSLRTSARMDGDELVLNGQKVWTTAGISANWLFALVRTDPTARSSKALSFVLVDLKQPGVEVRGITNLNGHTEFAEVFLTDARAELRNVVGEVGAGARVAVALLGFERGASGVAWAAALRVEIDRIVLLAQSRGRWSDPVIRDRISRAAVQVELIRGLAARALNAGDDGRAPGPESSVIKSLIYEHRQSATELAMEILGRDGLVPAGETAVEWQRPQPWGTAADLSQVWIDDFLNARAGTIYGGSSEIQRDTIAERVLGLPRDGRPSAQRDGVKNA